MLRLEGVRETAEGSVLLGFETIPVEGRRQYSYFFSLMAGRASEVSVRWQSERHTAFDLC